MSRLKVHVLLYSIIVCLGLIRWQRRCMSEGKQQAELYLNKTRAAYQAGFWTYAWGVPVTTARLPNTEKNNRNRDV